MGAINMLGLAKRVKAKILQASTSEIYGDPVVHPQKEDCWGNVNTIGPRSTLAREQLGWEPKINLKKGLLRTIEYFRAVV